MYLYIDNSEKTDIINAKLCSCLEFSIHKQKTELGVKLFCILYVDDFRFTIGEIEINSQFKEIAIKSMKGFWNGILLNMMSNSESNNFINLSQKFEVFAKDKPWENDYKGGEE